MTGSTEGLAFALLRTLRYVSSDTSYGRMRHRQGRDTLREEAASAQSYFLIYTHGRALLRVSPARTELTIKQSEDGQCRDARVVVESEDEPERLLLDTSICKEDGFQKQRGTLFICPPQPHHTR